MNERDTTLLNDYFNGLLSPEAAQAVERRAAEDAAFGQEFELRRQMEAFPRRAAQRQVFTEMLTAVGSDFFQGKGEQPAEKQPIMTGRVSRLRWLAAAASLALVAAAVWFFTRSGAPSYRQYAMHEPLSLTERGEADETAAEAEAAFNAQDYVLALPALERLLAAEPDNLRARLYKGICLIELGRTAEAREVLSIIAGGASALRGEALWYIALSYLKDENTTACREALSNIPPEEARYAQAQELLKKLGPD